MQLKHFVFFSLDSQFRSINTLYTKPYTRIGGYFAGVWTGYYLSKVNREWTRSKVSDGNYTICSGVSAACSAVASFIAIFSLSQFTAFLRILSLVIVAFLVFIQRYRVAESFWVSFLFPAFGRMLWSLPICFMIIDGCSNHKHGEHHGNHEKIFSITKSFSFHQGLVTKILNSKILLPLSRMTFAAYLLNPLVVLIITMSCETSFHLDFYTIGIYTVGFYIVTYLAAMGFMLLFENPITMFIRKFAE